MGEEIKEECGVLAVCLKDFSKNSDRLVQLGHRGLSGIQHRGQTGAGIVVHKLKTRDYEKVLDVLKSPGTVYQLFGGEDDEKRKQIYADHAGVGLIGHVRYGTSGNRKNAEDYTQPFYRRHGRVWKKFALSFNGNLANFPELEKELMKNDYDLETSVDTELIMHLFSSGLNRLYQASGQEKKQDF